MAKLRHTSAVDEFSALPALSRRASSELPSLKEAAAWRELGGRLWPLGQLVPVAEVAHQKRGALWMKDSSRLSTIRFPLRQPMGRTLPWLPIPKSRCELGRFDDGSDIAIWNGCVKTAHQSTTVRGVQC